MSVTAKYQISLFVPFQPFSAAPESFRKAFELFFPRGYFPGTIQEQAPGSPATDRLSLANNGLGINVQFLSGRIDFLAAPFAASKNQLSLNKFTEEVKALANLILQENTLKVERVALISEHMVDDLDPTQLDLLSKKFIAPTIESFSQSPNIEWSVRQIIRQPLSDDYKIICNQVYSVARGTVQFADQSGVRTFEAIQLTLDINTYPTPQSTFDEKAIQAFVTNAHIAHDSLLSQLKGQIYGH